ncbi:hypothetical protein C5688_17215 [Methylocystis sp. MitZ-2018]|nr:hypothetical protein C5688_17215 [Methylocystis sp. MitZ-2018]
MNVAQNQISAEFQPVTDNFRESGTDNRDAETFRMPQYDPRSEMTCQESDARRKLAAIEVEFAGILPFFGRANIGALKLNAFLVNGSVFVSAQCQKADQLRPYGVGARR